MSPVRKGQKCSLSLSLALIHLTHGPTEQDNKYIKAGQEHDSLAVCISMNVIYFGEMRAVLSLAHFTGMDIDEITQFETLVFLRYFE